MEKRKKVTRKIFPLCCVIVFTLMGLASSTSEKATVRDGINGFIDGWEQSGARSDVELTDSLMTSSNYDMAFQTIE